tara:strand:+ start:101 stop:274 length:174 start_codon:yes stop_codon:yes gene_type:complete
MTHLKKESHATELSEFNKKFLNKKKSFIISSDINGNIISVDTKDKEIIEYVKKIGLK